jgi:hypothetical protein
MLKDKCFLDNQKDEQIECPNLFWRIQQNDPVL